MGQSFGCESVELLTPDTWLGASSSLNSQTMKEITGVLGEEAESFEICSALKGFPTEGRTLLVNRWSWSCVCVCVGGVAMGMGKIHVH